MNHKDCFFCYDLDMSRYLRFEKKIEMITIAINPKSKRIYTLFARSEHLSNCIGEFNKNKLTLN